MKLNKTVRKNYEAPAFVYEGKISTRAGSPENLRGGDGVDPANLFGND